MMFYIQNKTTGWFMSGYCMWVPETDTALPFHSEVGAHAVANMMQRSGLETEVIHGKA